MLVARREGELSAPGQGPAQADSIGAYRPQVEYFLTQNSAGRVQALKVVGENGVFQLWYNPSNAPADLGLQALLSSAWRIRSRRTASVRLPAVCLRPSTAERAATRRQHRLGT